LFLTTNVLKIIWTLRYHMTSNFVIDYSVTPYVWNKQQCVFYFTK